MKTTQTVEKLEAQLAQIKAQLQKHGAMRPGSLSRQYNVCGKPGCRCKDPEHPRRHGPYYQLNYVYRGKKTSQFIRREILSEVRTELVNCSSMMNEIFAPLAQFLSAARLVERQDGLHVRFHLTIARQLCDLGQLITSHLRANHRQWLPEVPRARP
jgi:uncharacterized protein DUF6788